MNGINYLASDVEYIDRPNHLVIAALHLHRLPESKIPEFLGKVDTLKGMKIEGAPLPPDVPYNCIEVLAKVAMLGKPFEYMATKRPDGTLMGEVITEYGLPLEIVEIYQGFKPLLLADMKPIGSDEDMVKFVLQAIATAKDKYPNLDEERALKNQNKILKNLLFTGKIGMPDINAFCNAYLLYHGQIIEYEFMQPDILDFRGRIDGKIGVLAGSFHAEGINGMLEGRLKERPVSWPEYKKGLYPEDLDLVESIEDLILNHED